MTIITLIAATIMGFVLGLLGGGGSILAVPVLVYLAGVDPKAAIATSLLVVGTTSAFAAINHARVGNVVWKAGLIFGGFAMGGAYLGGRLGQFIPGNVLLMLFAGLMLVTSVMMLRKKKTPADAAPEAQEDKPMQPLWKIGAEGLVVGAVTGLVGAGGGFLVVPALAILGGLSMRRAIGTSLTVIAMKSFAGFAGYAGFVEIDYTMVGSFIAAALVGTFLGSMATRRIEAAKLRTAFAYFVLLMGIFILAQKLDLIPLDAPKPAEATAQTTES